MDINKFNQLPLKEQAQLIWKHGTNLAVRKDKHFVINLYALDNFFVEIYNCPEEVCINKIISFKSSQYLNPYLEKIKF